MSEDIALLAANARVAELESYIKRFASMVEEGRLSFGAEIERLRAENERLTKERDEARLMAQRPEEHGAAMQARVERLEVALRNLTDEAERTCESCGLPYLWTMARRARAALAEGTK